VHANVVGGQASGHRFHALPLAGPQQTLAVALQRRVPVGVFCGFRQALDMCRTSNCLFLTQQYKRPARNSLSAACSRNQLPGTVLDIQVGDIMTYVVVKVGENIGESVITRTSAETLGLRKGDSVKGSR
jgi:molybdopterin-binding protein